MPHSSDRDDADLVARARSGDQAAFSQLVASHEGQVLRTALRIMGNREDARDVAQEVFLRLHRYRGTLDPERQLGAWLYRVTVNVCRTLLRRARRASRVSIDDVTLREHPAELVTAPEQHRQAEARDASRMLASVLGRLPVKERTVLILRDLEGLTSSQVAAVLRCTQGTVRSHLCRARARLRELLTASEGGSP